LLHKDNRFGSGCKEAATMAVSFSLVQAQAKAKWLRRKLRAPRA
jgi:hypothetical protein